MKLHFRIIGSPQPQIISPQFGLIDLRKLTTKEAFNIWKSGFKHLGITPEGAKKYLSKINSAELAKIILSKNDLDDVLILAKLNKAAAVRKAKEEMVLKLTPEKPKRLKKQPKQEDKSEESGS
jgi:hypothetical protein